MASRISVCDVCRVVSCSLHAFCWLALLYLHQSNGVNNFRLAYQYSLSCCVYENICRPLSVFLVWKKDDFYRTLSISAQSVPGPAQFAMTDYYIQEGWIDCIRTVSLVMNIGPLKILPCSVRRSDGFGILCNIDKICLLMSDIHYC